MHLANGTLANDVCTAGAALAAVALAWAGRRAAWETAATLVLVLLAAQARALEPLATTTSSS